MSPQPNSPSLERAIAQFPVSVVGHVLATVQGWAPGGLGPKRAVLIEVEEVLNSYPSEHGIGTTETLVFFEEGAQIDVLGANLCSYSTPDSPVSAPGGRVLVAGYWGGGDRSDSGTFIIDVITLDISEDQVEPRPSELFRATAPQDLSALRRSIVELLSSEAGQ